MGAIFLFRRRRSGFTLFSSSTTPTNRVSFADSLAPISWYLFFWDDYRLENVYRRRIQKGRMLQIQKQRLLLIRGKLLPFSSHNSSTSCSGTSRWVFYAHLVESKTAYNICNDERCSRKNELALAPLFGLFLFSLDSCQNMQPQSQGRMGV